MPTSAEMREHSRLLREASRNETDPSAKRELAKRALDFAFAAQENDRLETERINRDKN